MLGLYNTLTRRVEEIAPLEQGMVRIYSCGPTVYRHAHIGNLRSYLMADWIRRALEFQGLKTLHVKNITDVGHMRQEMLDRGEDKVIAAARAEGKTAGEIAQFYTEGFFQDEARLNILPAHHFPRAAEHVLEMLELVVRLVEKGCAYEVNGNVYFEVSRFPDYGRLSGNLFESQLMEGVRAEVDPQKKDPRDFVLWRAAEPERELKWPSPWGDGFPGWHIECSAMSTKYLGQRFDVHTGGVDNIFPHHEGEIAQSEGAFGHRVVNHWVHGQHLLADGVKMAKSAGNSYTLDDLESRGIDPLAFRYLCLTTRYSTPLNFTFSSLKAAQRAFLRLRNHVWEWSSQSASPSGHGEVEEGWRVRFLEHINSNLDCPGALALTWELVLSDLPGGVKLRLLLGFDQVLGLGLDRVSEEYRVAGEIMTLAAQRSNLRGREMYEEADELRNGLESAGYRLEDSRTVTRVRPKTAWERYQETWRTISSPAEVPSLIGFPDTRDLSIGIVACNYMGDVRRCVESALHWAGARAVELVVVDNYSTDGTGRWLEEFCKMDDRVRVIHTDHVLGEAAAKNAVLKRSKGRVVVLIDTSVEVTGDIYTPLEEVLSDEMVGVAGPFGLRTGDLRHFHEVEGGEVDAMQAYCFAFRRALLEEVGLMRESFRFYRNLDIEYSFHFRDRGYRIVADPSLPLRRHEHRVWAALSEEERHRLSHRNLQRFLDRWGHRHDLLVGGRGEL